MNEARGLLNVASLRVAGYTRTGEQLQVGADIDVGMVRLNWSGGVNYPAGLTPDEARYIARSLYRMARLVEGA